jgi:hypothetical protein
VILVSQRSRVRLYVLTARVPSSHSVWRRPRVCSAYVVQQEQDANWKLLARRLLRIHGAAGGRGERGTHQEDEGPKRRLGPPVPSVLVNALAQPKKRQDRQDNYDDADDIDDVVHACTSLS